MTSRLRLVLALGLAAACKRGGTDVEAPVAAAAPTTMHVQASAARLREGPDESAATVDRLQIGTAVAVSELGPAWARVCAPSACGWVARETLGVEPPTLEWAIEKHDALPLEDAAGRRSWAERAAALAPEDVGVLERLVAALEKAGDEAALARARRGLQGVRESLARSAIVGIVVRDGAAARAAPTVDSDLVQSYRAGEVVRVLRESRIDAANRVFVAVLAADRRGWMELDALLVPDLHHLYDLQAAGTDPAAPSWTAAPQAATLFSAGFAEKLLANEDVAARRLVTQALFARIASEIVVLEEGVTVGCGPAGRGLAELWSALQRDPDAEVRQAANQGLLGVEANGCALREPMFREAVAARLTGAKPALTEVERTQLGQLVTLGEKYFANDPKMAELRALLNR